MVSAGVIGAGYGTRMLVPALRAAGIEVLVICSRDTKRASESAQRLDIPHWTSNVSQLVRTPGLELVCVASPPALHYEHVMVAVEAGRHVLCEKPMALNLEQAQEMYEAAEKARLVHAIDHEFRFLPARARVAELLRSGALGDVRMVDIVEHATRLSDKTARENGWWLSREEGGGQLGALGSHWIDALLWWLGPVEHVASELAAHVAFRPTHDSTRPVEVTADDSAALLMRFESGAIATLAVSAVATHPSRRATIVAENGRVELAGNSHLRIEWRDAPAEAYSYVDRSEEAGQPGQPAALASLFDAIRRRIAGDPAAPSFATFEAGVRVQSILDRAYDK